MRAVRRSLARIRGLMRGHADAEADLRAEMEAHLYMEIQENIRRGMTPDEARRRAMVAAGGMTQAAEQVREQRGLPWIESIAADARYALRHFRRTPMATIAMVLVLSLGIGTNVVLLTVLNSLATLPAPGIARDAALVRIRGTLQIKDVTGVEPRLLSWPEVQAYAGHPEVFSSVAAQANESAVVTFDDATITPSVIYTTPNYFSTLGVHPLIGTEPIANPNVTRLTTSLTATISYAMWQQKFGGARDAIGKIIRVNDVPVQIVSIAPKAFHGTSGGNALTMWVPLAAYPVLQKRTPAVFLSTDSAFLTAFGRLRAGVTTANATPIVAGLGQSTTAAGEPVVAHRDRIESADVAPMLSSNARVSERADLLVSAAASGGFALLILLITCTNVSALMVGLAVARRREIGVRLSLGASRARLIRQLVTESVLLALIAAALGLVVTAVGTRGAATMLDDVQLVVDWHVIVATCMVAVVSGVLFGLSPALHATRVSVSEVLKSAGSSVSATRSRLQRGLVVAQIALTQPLLVALGVLVTTTIRDARSTSSAVSSRIAEIEVDTWSGRVSNEERAARIEAIVDRVAALPGVVAAMPMQMGMATAPVTVHPADRVAGVTYAPRMMTRLTAAPKRFFDAFEIRIVRGRDFTEAEYAKASNDPMKAPSFESVIIGSDLARRLWRGANPIGRRLMLPAPSGSSSAAMVVVGVVDEVTAGPSDVDNVTRVYVPYAAINSGVIARTIGPALPMLNTMRPLIAAEALQMPINRAQTMEQREAQLRREIVRTSSAVAGAGILALLLSAIGLYAVVSFAVAQRTREIGIRTALGAPGGRVVRSFFTNGLALSVAGLVLGLPLSMIATRLISTTLNLPVTSSPLIGVVIGALVLVVASFAVWIPARRASAVDPIVALRAE
jgi:predicted permease